MRRVGFVWCAVVTIFVFFGRALISDPSEPRSELLVTRFLKHVEPSLLASFLELIVLFLVVLGAAAVVRSAWNRIAPHMLEGAKAITLAEAYAVMLVLGMFM